jgi:beta-carotene 3-hydroxylase
MVLCGIFMLIITKDHKSWFERNDLFFIIYAVPSWLLIMFGMMNQYAWYMGGFWYFILWHSLFFRA